MPELTVHTHTPFLCSLGQLLTHSRQSQHLLSGPSTSSPSSLCRGRPWGSQSNPCSCAGSQAWSLCLQIPTGLSRLQTQGVHARKLPKVAEQTTMSSSPLLWTGWDDHFSHSKTWCNSSLQHKELFSACRNSTVLKIRLKYFAEPEPWSGGLCPLNRKASLRSRRWHAKASGTLQYAHKRFQNVSA